MSARIQTLAAYLTTLRVGRMSRPAFERWQSRQLTRWLTHDLRSVDFYRDCAPRLDALPIIDKGVVMARYDAFNRARITAEAGWAALAGPGQIDGIRIGASTGTSGNRTLYAVTAGESHRWLGTILAKAIPGFLFCSERVAVILPQSSALYDGANQTGRIRLKFFDLRAGPESWTPDLLAFDPTTLVAPPRVLRHLAGTAPQLKPRRIFSAAEALDPVDRQTIETHFAVKLGQIYMASEGLFGVSCAHGRLHLAEDANHFEFEPVGDGLVSPLVTGFRRTFQIMARYRMNDLLRLSATACPCGSPLRVIDEVVGRLDDAFAFGAVLVTPDVMRNAVLDAARRIDDFRILREDESRVTLVLRPDVSGHDAEAAAQALSGIFTKRGLRVSIDTSRAPLTFEAGRKLRRVENRWKGQA